MLAKSCRTLSYRCTTILQLAATILLLALHHGQSIRMVRQHAQVPNKNGMKDPCVLNLPKIEKAHPQTMEMQRDIRAHQWVNDVRNAQ